MQKLRNACHVLYFPFAAMAAVGLLDLVNLWLGGHILLPSLEAAVIALNVGIVGGLITYHIAGPLEL